MKTLRKSNKMIGLLKLIVSWLGGKETIECQINCFSINHFYKTVDNKVIKFPLHLTDLTFNNLTDLTPLITFFILALLLAKFWLVHWLFWLVHFKVDVYNIWERMGLLSNKNQAICSSTVAANKVLTANKTPWKN